ncbi:hypothetical protein [Acetivibrio clariflavus]|uniref:Uncharacterized protein n=1 Tax=Acetivibrio clariflavus (strain DSM 19732 / NBRC 101661 / EBR45) TaxID=720554 RepID=G8LW42_ACECE|nr:hypothetical protein [Acetivibrio clariflavus]AEV68646.1 hypothetical protein Clocl_2048 [Acetivibrio clariflavus DSM 19732]
MAAKDKVNNIEALIDATKDENLNERKQNWAAFVESTVVNFFIDCKLEKLNIEDGKGNKAKLVRQKDDSIKVEYTSTTTL